MQTRSVVWTLTYRSDCRLRVRLYRGRSTTALHARLTSPLPTLPRRHRLGDPLAGAGAVSHNPGTVPQSDDPLRPAFPESFVSRDCRQRVRHTSQDLHDVLILVVPLLDGEFELFYRWHPGNLARERSKNKSGEPRVV